jgi:hypothetical protein
MMGAVGKYVLQVRATKWDVNSRALLKPEGLRVLAGVDYVLPDSGGRPRQLRPRVFHLGRTREALLGLVEGRVEFVLSASRRIAFGYYGRRPVTHRGPI